MSDLKHYATAMTTDPETGKPMAKVTLSGSKVALKRNRNTYATLVSAGGTNIIQFVPRSGYIGRVNLLGVYIPGISGSTGNHNLKVTVGGDYSYSAENLVNISSTGTTAITQRISDDAEVNRLKGVIFDENNPLQITYVNGTDLDQTGTRFIFVVFEEEAIIT